jgi:hypothetical protein
MKPLRGCSQYEIIDHWRTTEHYRTIFFRCDIIEKLPNDLKWFEVEIESNDIEKMYIISSDDWRILTSSFRVIDVVNSISKGKIDEKFVPNILEKKIKYEENINSIDRKLILVSPTIHGNFTIIEGNKRAVALHSINKLVGNTVYLGISNDVRSFVWARYAELSL